MEGFTNGLGCHFKENVDQARKNLGYELFYSELAHGISHAVYYSARDNIHRCAENDNTVLSGLKKSCEVTKFLKKHLL